MDVKNAITRARRGLREERRLYIVAVTSLAVAFICLGATLLGVTNLDAAATRWGQSGRITLFLKDDADPQDIAQLRVVLEGLGDVNEVTHVTPTEARESFLAEADVGAGHPAQLAGKPDLAQHDPEIYEALPRTENNAWAEVSPVSA